MKICGEYNRFGYRIIDETGRCLYHAGNSPHDSQVYIDLVQGLSLATLRRYCRSTAKDLAAERRAEYGGVVRSEEEE